MKTLKILFHIILVIPLCLFIFVSSKSQQDKVIQFWCKKLLSIFEVAVELKGVTEKLFNQKKVSKIFDSKNFTADLIVAFKKMYQNR